MASTDLGLTSTLVSIILGVSPSPVPQTTLAAQASAGATTLSLTDGSGFAGLGATASGTDTKGLLMFSDTLGEEPWAFSLSGSTATLKTAGTGNTGLAFTHTAGTTVYTNLFDFAPNKLANLLQTGYPVIWVYGDEETTNWRQTRGMLPTFRLCVGYAIQIYRPQPQAGLDTNIWSRRQQRKARTDVKAIASAIHQNPTLKVAGQEYALDLGRVGQFRSETTRVRWRPIIETVDSHVLQAELVVTVTGQGEPINPP